MAGDDGGQPLDAQAALVEGAGVGAERGDDGVDEFERRLRRAFTLGGDLRRDVGRVLDDGQRQRDADLRRGQPHPDARQVPEHRVEQLAQQPVGQLAVVRSGRAAQHGVADLGDGPGPGRLQHGVHALDQLRAAHRRPPGPAAALSWCLMYGRSSLSALAQ